MKARSRPARSVFLLALCLAMGGAASVTRSQPCAPVPAGLVSSWRAEGNGMDAVDGNDAILINGEHFTAGKVGRAFDFGGTNHVRVWTASNLHVQSFTVEAWIYRVAGSTLAPILEYADSTRLLGIHLWHGPQPNGSISPPLEGSLYANLVDTSGRIHPFGTLAGAIPSNQWTHVALTFDQGSGLARLYADGVIAASANLGSITPLTALAVNLGYRPPRNSYGSGSYFVGAMDEVAFYNRALSDFELRAIYDAGSAGKCPAPPSVVTQPASRTVYIGDLVKFTVSATGDKPLSYQWRFNGIDLTGATSTALSLVNVQFTNAGNYSVRVFNAAGATNSANAELTVNPQPPCTAAPAGLVSWWRFENDAADNWDSNNGSGSASFAFGKAGRAFLNPRIRVPDSIALRMTNALTIEAWINPATFAGTIPQTILAKFDWRTDITSGTESSYLLGLTNNGVVFFTLSATGSYLTNTTLFTTQSAPADQWTFVVATYDGTRMRLYLDGALVAAKDHAGGIYAGTANLGIGGVAIGGGALSWPFSGLLDEVSLYNRVLSPAEILEVYNAQVSGKCLAPPAIAVQPQDQAVPLGDDAKFTVSVTGSRPLNYQWRFNGEVIAGATTSALQLEKVGTNQAGLYHVSVTNALGYDISANAALKLLPAPTCTTVPAGLVSWWRGETNSVDNWDSNNNGDNRGGFAAGRVGWAFSYPRVRVPDAPSLRFTNALTIKAWIYPFSFAGSTPRAILAKAQPNGLNTSYLLGLTTNGFPFLSLSASGVAPTNTSLVATQPVPANRWSFVAATYDGSHIRLYINGQLANAMDYIGGIYPGSADLGLGIISFGGSGFSMPLAGLLDEVSLYRRALTAEEILSIYNARAAGKCLEPPTIVGQPKDQDVPLGEDALFSVSIQGSRPLKYQWRFYGSVIAGATKSVLLLERVTTNQAGFYDVAATNDVGYVLSASARLGLRPPPNCTTLTNGLISWWPADGNTGDVMGANHISAFSPALYGTGKVDRAFSFNGTNSRVTVPGSVSLSFGSNAPFSIEMWIRAWPTNSSSTSVILVEQALGSGIIFSYWGYSLSLYQGRLAFTMGNGSFQVFTFVTDGPDLRDGLFHHVAVSVDPDVAAGSRLYVDGQALLSFDSAWWIGNRNIGSPLHFGAPSPGTFNGYFGGLIDEPAIYNRALSAAEILAIRNAGAAGRCKYPPTILVQPASQRITVGSNVTFTVTAVGPPPLFYQWLLNGLAITYPSTDSNFTFNVRAAQGGNYAARVSNVFGTIVSSNALLTVNFVPVVSSPSLALPEDTTMPVLVATDPNDDLLDLTILIPPQHGALGPIIHVPSNERGSAGNWVTYTPAAEYSGPDSFTYKVNDGLVDSAPATVSLTVQPVNDAPCAKFTASPLAEFAGITNLIILAPVGENARAVLDAAQSWDVENDPLQYFWSEGTNTFASGVHVTNEFAPGSHTVTLTVSDGQITGTAATEFEVLRPAEAVGFLIAAIEDSDVGQRHATPLIASLRNAAKSFENGNAPAGINQLQAFQNKVQAQIAPSRPSLAAQWIAETHQIIDVVSQPEKPLASNSPRPGRAPDLSQPDDFSQQ